MFNKKGFLVLLDRGDKKLTGATREDAEAFLKPKAHAYAVIELILRHESEFEEIFEKEFMEICNRDILNVGVANKERMNKTPTMKAIIGDFKAIITEGYAHGDIEETDKFVEEIISIALKRLKEIRKDKDGG